MLSRKSAFIKLSCVFAALQFVSFNATAQDILTFDITGKRNSGGIGSFSGDAGGLPAKQSSIIPIVQVRTAKLRNQGNTKNTNTKCDDRTKKPVIIATGEKYIDEDDFTAVNEYGLSLKRFYRSAGGPGSSPIWRFSLDYPVLQYPIRGVVQVSGGYTTPAAVAITLPDGTQWTYRYYGENADDGHGDVLIYTSDNLSYPGRLTFRRDGSAWQLYRNGITYHYTSGGQLESFTTNSGAKTSFFYNGPGSTLSQVVNAAGQTVQFKYQSSQFPYVITQVVDPNGGIWNYEYDVNQNLSKVTSPGSVPDIRQYHYESTVPSQARLLTGITVNGVRYTRYFYDSTSRVQQSGLENGEEVDKFSYGTNQTIVTDQYGQVVAHSFANLNGEMKETSVSRAGTSTCAASAAQTAYDSNGNTDYTVDWNGNTTDYSYDSQGRLISSTIAANTASAITQIMTWDEDDITSVQTSGADRKPYYQADYNYSFSGADYRQLLSLKETDLKTGVVRQNTYSYTFWPSGVINTRTVAAISASGNRVSTYTYDQFGNLITLTNPLGQQEKWSGHDQLGRPAHYTDINGVTTDYIYQPNGNLTSIQQNLPEGVKVTQIAYNNMHLPTDISYSTGKVDRFRYTSGGRLEGTGDALNNFAHTTIDIVNRIIRQSSPREVPGSSATPTAVSSGEFSTSTVLDSQGHVYTRTGNSGQNFNYRYDANGNLLSVTDAIGRISSYTYDELNRLVTSTVPDGGKTIFSYDVTGHLYTVRDPRGLTTTYQYNSFGDKVRTISPDTGTTTYSYDDTGRLSNETFADAKVVVYSWDPLGRLQTETSGNVQTTFIYDEGAFGKGMLTRIIDRTGETQYEYNAAGQILRQTNSVMGKIFNTRWTYDSAGHKLTMAYPSGFMLKYSYDNFGKVSSIKANDAR
jgi:YD repeat-containing protein